MDRKNNYNILWDGGVLVLLIYIYFYNWHISVEVASCILEIGVLLVCTYIVDTYLAWLDRSDTRDTPIHTYRWTQQKPTLPNQHVSAFSIPFLLYSMSETSACAADSGSPRCQSKKLLTGLSSSRPALLPITCRRLLAALPSLLQTPSSGTATASRACVPSSGTATTSRACVPSSGMATDQLWECTREHAREAPTWLQQPCERPARLQEMCEGGRNKDLAWRTTPAREREGGGPEEMLDLLHDDLGKHRAESYREERGTEVTLMKSVGTAMLISVSLSAWNCFIFSSFDTLVCFGRLQIGAPFKSANQTPRDLERCASLEKASSRHSCVHLVSVEA